MTLVALFLWEDFAMRTAVPSRCLPSGLWVLSLSVVLS